MTEENHPSAECASDELSIELCKSERASAFTERRFSCDPLAARHPARGCDTNVGAANAGASEVGEAAEGRAATARYLRGRAYTSLGQFELARDDLYAARALHPGHRDVGEALRVLKHTWADKRRADKVNHIPHTDVVLLRTNPRRR